MAPQKSVIYQILRPFVWAGVYLFFRRVVVDGAHKVPKNRPVILVANHQNALLDPVVLCVTATTQVHWLTRADVFKNPLINRFLRRINMLPVYRERDRVADLHDRNNEIFEQCHLRMKNNAAIGIFPEGTHRGKKQLVPLKKGLARLVIGAHEAGVRNLCIVPVGLDYESFFDAQKNLLVKYGDPIEVESFLSNTDATHAKLHVEITQRVHNALCDLMIHIDSEDVHHEILALKPLLDALHPKDSLLQKYDRFHAFAKRLDASVEYHSFLNNEVNHYRTGMHQLKISEELFSRPITFWHWLFVVVGCLPALLATLVFWPMQAFTERFVHTVIKDTLFRNSIRISFWTFLTPFYLFAVFGVLYAAGVSAPYLYLPWLAVPAGLITLPWWRCAKHVVHALRCSRMQNTEDFQHWLKARDTVVQWLNRLPYLKKDV